MIRGKRLLHRKETILDKTKQLIRDLAARRGYTITKIIDEAAERGYGTRAEAVSALRWPVNACPLLTPALKDILELSDLETDRLFWGWVEEIGAEVRTRRSIG